MSGRELTAEVWVSPTITDIGWRWDVTWITPVEGEFPGVHDCRRHVRADFGYTRTRWAAWRAVRRAVEQGGMS